MAAIGATAGLIVGLISIVLCLRSRRAAGKETEGEAGRWRSEHTQRLLSLLSYVGAVHVAPKR